LASAPFWITCSVMARGSAAPVFDYKMIDGSYLLAPVAVAWLLDDERSRTSAAAFSRCRSRH